VTFLLPLAAGIVIGATITAGIAVVRWHRAIDRHHYDTVRVAASRARTREADLDHEHRRANRAEREATRLRAVAFDLYQRLTVLRRQTQARHLRRTPWQPYGQDLAR
jgi:hypothetical protein